jgi:hypothetical protein
VNDKNAKVWPARSAPGPASEASQAPRLCILVGALTERNGLRRIPVAIVTRGYKGKQQYSVTAADLAAIVRNFRKKTVDVPVDFEHSTLYAAGDPAPTAAWLREIDDQPDADGVLWGWCDYTKTGAASVAARDYKYVSPVIEWTKRDKTTGELQGATITSLALTKQPLFESLPELPLVASDTQGWSFERSGNERVMDEEKASQIDAELWNLADEKIRASGGKLDAAVALKMAAAENPRLVHEWNCARYETVEARTFRRALAEANEECVHRTIDAIICEKIAASEGRLDYGQAYKMILNERPDLHRKMAEAIRLRD